MIRLNDLSLQATAGLSMSCFVAMATKYNPLINYDWSTTTTSGLRYLKDVGSTPTYNASMYFGRGAYLNGVDQTITVPINTTIQTALKRVNGVVTINEASQTLTNYVISGLGVHKDYYLFTRLLTTAEKDSYINTPELFYAMAQADSNCVLNMPMYETDGYARNMKSYSEGSELLVNFNTHTDNSAWRFGTVTNQPDGFTKIEYGDYTNVEFYLREINSEFLSDLIVGDNYYIDAEVKTDSTICYPDISGLPATGALSNAQGIRRITGIITASSTNSNYIRAYCATDNRNVYWKINTIKKLSGIHQITNYTSSVRDNAKNLQYGLQTCKFARNSLGVIQSASNYLECNGTGYAIIPNHADTVNIKMTVNPTSLSGNLLSGGVTKTLTGLTLNVDNDVVINDVTPTGAITLASGFSGTIKTYTEELS